MPHTDLVNMKRTPKELKEDSEPMLAADRPTYPYGLRLRLDEDELDKLALDSLPKVGTTLMLVAHVDVVSVSEAEHTGDEGTHAHRNVELQITDLALEAKTDRAAASDVLYGKGEAKA